MEEMKQEPTVTQEPKKRGRKKKVDVVVAQPAVLSEVTEPKMELLISENQMNILKIALGWNESNPLRTPDKASFKTEPKSTLYAYRNRFFTDRKPQLEELVEQGYMEHAQFGTNGITHEGYKVTQKGIDYVAEVYNINIKITAKK